MCPANERRHSNVTSSHWLGPYKEWSLSSLEGKLIECDNGLMGGVIVLIFMTYWNYIINKQLYVLSIQTVDALTWVYFETTFLWVHNTFPLMILYLYTKKFHCVIHTYQCTIPAGRAGRSRSDVGPRQSTSDRSRIGSNALRQVCMVMKKSNGNKTTLVAHLWPLLLRKLTRD